MEGRTAPARSARAGGGELEKRGGEHRLFHTFMPDETAGATNENMRSTLRQKRSNRVQVAPYMVQVLGPSVPKVSVLRLKTAVARPSSDKTATNFPAGRKQGIQGTPARQLGCSLLWLLFDHFIAFFRSGPQRAAAKPGARKRLLRQHQHKPEPEPVSIPWAGGSRRGLRISTIHRSPPACNHFPPARKRPEQPRLRRGICQEKLVRTA